VQIVTAAAALVAAVVLVDMVLPRSTGAGAVALRPKNPPPVSVQQATGFDNRATTSSQGDQPRLAHSAPNPSGSKSTAQGADEASSDVNSLDPSLGSEASAAPIDPPPAETSDASVAETTGVSTLAADDSAAIGPLPLSAEIGAPPIDGALAALAPPSLGPAKTAAKVTHLLVARDLPQQVPPDAEFHASLASACLRAAELNLNEIELQWSGPLLQPPLEIVHPRLTLRATAGFRPVVLFRPDVSIADRHMVRLGGGLSSRLTIQGVELWLELPREPTSGWSLIAVRPGQALELGGCVLTVQDGDASRLPVHDQVAMIAVQPRLMSETMTMEPTMAMAAGTTISIDRSIVRGEATMISLSEDSPLTLRWSQGLLVTPRRLLETTGSAAAPKSFDLISLTLDNVTAACRQGLYLMKRRAGAAHHYALEVTTNHCILMTDPGAPLYDFSGISEVNPNQLRCEGEANRYPQLDVTFLRVTPPDQREVLFDLRDRGAWSMESQPQPLIDAWRQPPALDRPAHEQTKEAFALKPDAQIDAGFDPTLLPTVDARAAAPPRPAAEDGDALSVP
jgi:hypothetical protein